MPGNFTGWLYGLGSDGSTFELINHARTAAYLRGIGMPNGMLLCNVLGDGGCSSLPYLPPCGDGGVVSHAAFSASTGLNYMNVPDSAAIQAATQLDVRFAIDGVASQTITRYLALHGSSSSSNRTWDLKLTTAPGGDNCLVLGLSTSGTTGPDVVCDVPLTNSNDLVLGRVTWRNSDGRGQFFRKLGVDPLDIATELASNTGWEQIGGNETAFSGTTLYTTGSIPLVIGGRASTTDEFIGNLYGFWLAPTIDAAPGVAIYPANFPANTTAGSFPAATAQLVTIVRDGTGSQLQLVYERADGWDGLTFTTPATDNAPWYSSTVPESADALGFWVEQWTGLDNVHVKRNVQALGGSGGGGQLGVLSASERVMSLNVLLFARTEAAMEHLYRWLEQTLSNVCATCSTDSMLIRRYCPATTSNLWEGVAKLNQVGLIAGPQWEEEPLPSSACYLRRVNFTLAAGDPCMYGTGTEVAQDATVANVTTCLASLPLAEVRHPCRPTCTEMTAGSSCRSAFFYDVPEVAGALAPVVTMENTATEYTLPVRVIAYADPLGMETAPGVADPCALQILGEIYVRALPPGATFAWDVAARDVQYRDSTTGGLEPGWAYIDPNDPPERRWFALPCGKIVIVVELATLCLAPLGGGAYTDGVHTFNAPHYPDLALEIAPRWGCP